MLRTFFCTFAAFQTFRRFMIPAVPAVGAVHTFGNAELPITVQDPDQVGDRQFHRAFFHAIIAAGAGGKGDAVQKSAYLIQTGAFRIG